VLKKELMAHLRTARQMRQAKGGTTKSGLGQIVDAVSIRERPAEAEDRAVPGHWEGDLLCGANNTHIATLVERHTRFVMLLKVPNKDTANVVSHRFFNCVGASWVNLVKKIVLSDRRVYDSRLSQLILIPPLGRIRAPSFLFSVLRRFADSDCERPSSCALHSRSRRRATNRRVGRM
jgi:hypothetical protein